jgi:putative FmdB family regulatory protein
MPTYDYHCTACKHEFEEFQAMSAKTLRKCPRCGKNTLERKIGIGAGVLFKGGGFYETDYRSDSYKKAAEADNKPAASKTDAKSESKAEAKPETKPAAPSTPAAEPARASSDRVRTPSKPTKPAAAKPSKRPAPRKK